MTTNDDQLGVYDDEHYCDLVVPEASPVIHAIRSIGYTPETAIADLIDNSLDANAKNIKIDIKWDDESSFIRIEDDGTGMDDKTLVEAMRLGSKNPLDDRKVDTLGRFGMGLKTASLSLGKRLTVMTKSNHAVSIRCWDIDVINETNKWTLLRSPFASSAEYLGDIGSQSGTVILIEKLDRLVSPPYNGHKKNKFLRQIGDIVQHLCLVFHRFLEGHGGKITMTVNGNKLLPWNPLYPKHGYTVELPKEIYRVDGQSVEFEGYVLPHHSRLNRDEYTEMAGPHGWYDHQGFYIYRNNRLLIMAGWLSLFPREEATKLARVAVYISERSDFDWQIDVKKSVARPPQNALEHLRRWAEHAREISRRIYHHRTIPQQQHSDKKLNYDLDFMWEQASRQNKSFFRIYRKNPLLQQILKDCSDDVRERLSVYIRMLEEYCPVNTMTFAPLIHNDDELLVINSEHKSDILKIGKIYFQAGFKPEEAATALKGMPVYARYAHQELLRTLVEANL